MFWKKREKIPECEHYWHYLQDESITMSFDRYPYVKSGCWIFCHKCKQEKKVLATEWERIEKKQEILDKYKDK